jgi:hypothetical protein
MTDSLIKLDPLLPYWLLTILFALTITFLIWLELKKTTRYKNLRIICVFILAIAVFGIILHPKVRKQKLDFAILLTDNANLKIADSLEKQFPGAKMLFFGKGKTFSSSTPISSTNEIPPDEITVVVGDGLGAAALDIFDKQSFVFHPSPSPTGIIDLTLPKESKAQLQSTISGVYNNDLDSTKLVLEGPGGKEDSAVISKKGLNNFNLSFIPKQTGSFTYSLLINGAKEIIPIKVESEKRMKILVVQMFPTFETGYLKNVLSAEHELVFRYQLSKNNFRYEYINHQAIRADRLTNEILNEFDLVIVDTDALTTLSQSERKNLDAGISSGLGVLIVFNETPKSNRTLQSILPLTFKPISKDTAHFILTRKLNLPAWPVEAVNDGKIISTVKNKNRMLAGYIYRGFGKIGFQLLQETYKLTLEGDSSSYKNLWTTVLQKNARTRSGNFQIKIENDFPIYTNEPVTVEVIGSSQTPPTLIHNGIEFPMAEDIVIDDLWRTKVWPDKSGWQELQIKGDSIKQLYYVSENKAWRSLATANSIRNTKAMASTQPIDSTSSWEYKPFAPWLFYLMFLISASVLWLVPKL